MSAIKGFLSNTVTRSIDYLGTKYQMLQHYVSLKGLGNDSYGLQTSPTYSGVLAKGLSLDAGPVHTINALLITGHSLKVGDTLLFVGAGALQYQEPQVISIVDANTVIVVPALSALPAGGELFTQRRAVAPSTDMNGNLLITQATKTVVDSMDIPLDSPTGGRVIDAAGGTFLEIVASTAATISELMMSHDMGEFTNLYVGALGAEVFLCHLPLTPDEKVPVVIPAGSRLSIQAGKAVAINDSTSSYSINFIG